MSTLPRAHGAPPTRNAKSSSSTLAASRSRPVLADGDDDGAHEGPAHPPHESADGPPNPGAPARRFAGDALLHPCALLSPSDDPECGRNERKRGPYRQYRAPGPPRGRQLHSGHEHVLGGRRRTVAGVGPGDHDPAPIGVQTEPGPHLHEALGRRDERALAPLGTGSLAPDRDVRRERLATIRGAGEEHLRVTVGRRVAPVEECDVEPVAPCSQDREGLGPAVSRRVVVDAARASPRAAAAIGHRTRTSESP